MPSYFDLDRRFIERTNYSEDELIVAKFEGKRLNWPELLSQQFSIVVAPANFGKTTEMQHRSRKMRTDSEVAVFIALRRMFDRKTFEKALEPEDLAAYRAWKSSPKKKLTLFVDSLDEALAGDKEGIQYLISDILEELSWPNEWVQWVISTRPAVLTSEVIETIRRILVAPASIMKNIISHTNKQEIIGSKIIEEINSSSSDDEKKLHIYSMEPLNYKQAAAYLVGKYPKLPAKNILTLVRDRGLNGFTTSPGGLDILARIDLISDPPQSLTEVFNRVMDAVQSLRGTDRRLEAAGTSDPNSLANAARRIASASQVCQLVNIEMPEETLAIPEKALSARLVVGTIISERVLNQLLNSQLFIDVGFHQVKIYPDEIGPFLAAQRLAELAQSPELAHQLVQHFTWSSSSGEKGVYRQFLPLMGWLATLNPHCRVEILDVDPQALAFFGDLRNAVVPLDAAKKAITESIRRLVEQGDRLGRGIFNLTSENFWQAGSPRLEPLLRELFYKYRSHHRARDALLNIASASRSNALRSQVLREHGGRYERLIQRTMDVRYILELGVDKDLAGIASALITADSAKEGLVATLITRLGWSYFAPQELAELLVERFSKRHGGFHIRYAFDSGGMLDAASDVQLYEFCRGLVLRAARQCRGQREFHRRQASDKLVEFTVTAVAALANRPADGRLQRIAMLCMILHRVVIEKHLGMVDVSKFGQALDNNKELRHAFLKLFVQHVEQGGGKLWIALLGYKSIFSLHRDDVEALNSPLLRKVYEENERKVELQKIQSKTIKPTKEQHPKINAKVKKQLSSIVSQLRRGGATNGLAWVADWLLHTNPNSRYGEVRFELFEHEVGEEVAQAVREGLGQLWRKRSPLFKEDEPRTTHPLTVAGLQGLHIELGEGQHVSMLSHKEVRNALRYGVFEINGHPKWFWAVARANLAIATDELIKIVNEAGNGAVSREHAEELLTALDEAPVDIKRALAPFAWKFLLENKPSNVHAAEQLMAIVSGAPDISTQADFRRIALAKMKKIFSTIDQNQVEAPEDQQEEVVVWAAGWLMAFPESFHKAINIWGPRDPEAVRLFIFRLAAYLGSDRTGALVKMAKDSDAGVSLLGAMYEWTMWAVPPEDDTEHPDGEAYRPTYRDHAKQFRNSLIPAIAAAKSELGYQMLDRLRKKANGEREIYLRSVQFEMREAQFTRNPVRQGKFQQFEHNFRAEVTDLVSFSMAVYSDLLAVKYDIEFGEHSLRRFLSEVMFRRAPKSGINTSTADLALEADFQRLLASELNHHARGRYSVAVEPHTAEAKRRDVLCNRADWHASIELKMSRRWTLQDYIEALEKQLVGQYMRHRKATTGFLIIVLQHKNRRWRDQYTRKSMGFEEVLAILCEKARDLEAKNRNRYLRVIGIDATVPDNFRETQKNKSVGNLSKGSAVNTNAAGSKNSARSCRINAKSRSSVSRSTSSTLYGRKVKS